MNCPCCKGVMQSLVIDRVEIDECQSCHGLFFDNFEIKKLDEEHEGSGSELERILSYERAKTQRTEKQRCRRSIHWLVPFFRRGLLPCFVLGRPAPSGDTSPSSG